MPELQTVALEAALEAGGVLAAGFGRRHQVEFKGSSNNIVTEMDRQAEDIIAGHIRRAFPDHQILAEEGTTGAETGSYRWVIDPLDGTTNYAHGLPVFAVSIGVECEGALEAAVLYAPVLNELFIARRGGGATLNGRPIRVSEVERLDGAIAATAWSYDRTRQDYEMALFRAIGRRSQGTRRMGSAALELAYIGEGRLDLFWFWHTQPWDVAAGALIAAEAGARLTDDNGAPFTLGCERLVASNGRLHEEALAALNSVT
jgi:myo-inositol-1(or 4)-monophosphatase